MLAPMPSRLIALVLALVAFAGAPAPAAFALDSRWPDAEAYELQLIACNRSGGWVKDDGTCDTEDKAGRVPKRPELAHAVKLSDNLSRPYARRLARAGYLSHDLGGSIDQRFASIGMGDGRAGENIGYTGGRDDINAAVLHVHLMFQDEWSFDGPHWKNLTDRRFKKIGVGVWVRDGRSYLVLDFHS